MLLKMQLLEKKIVKLKMVLLVEEIVESGNITSPLSERILGRTPVRKYY